jgi:hypothetical protein
VKEEDAAAYEDVLCDGRSDHRDSLSWCFCSVGSIGNRGGELHTHTIRFLELGSSTGVHRIRMPKDVMELGGFPKGSVQQTQPK